MDETPQKSPDTFPCHWCSDGAHDLMREIKAIRNEGRCSVSMIMRRFRYGYAHALDVCRQLEARDWLKIVEGGRCELSGKILLSENGGSAHADGASFPKSASPPPSPVSVVTEHEKILGEQ